MPAIIEVDNVSKRFGALQAVRDCSLRVEKGSITGLIGPNGAGKTTLFNMVAGNFPPSSGSIRFNGRDVTALSAHERFHLGLLRTFQIAHEFANLTVLENLMAAAPGQKGETLAASLFRPGMVAAQEREVERKADEVIDFLKMGRVRHELAGNLSGGQKKLLELGRTMMADAKAVLLDEIAAGVNKTLLIDLADNIVRLNRELGYTFFVIEHDMDFIARLCDPVIVMASGSVLTQGTIEELKADDRVIEAYFGGSPTGHATRPAQAATS
jgi:branched-chain amino acid transport system ATP-binding protein